MARFRKALVAGTGAALILAAQMLPDDSPWKPLATAVLGIGVTYGVWRVPNAKVGRP